MQSAQLSITYLNWSYSFQPTKTSQQLAQQEFFLIKCFDIVASSERSSVIRVNNSFQALLRNFMDYSAYRQPIYGILSLDRQPVRMTQPSAWSLPTHLCQQHTRWLSYVAIHSRVHVQWHWECFYWSKPVFINFGCHPYKGTNVQREAWQEEAGTFVSTMKKVYNKFRAVIVWASDTMKWFYNQSKGISITYKEGNKVWLKAKNLKTTWPMEKFSNHQLGPSLQGFYFLVPLPLSHAITPFSFHIPELQPTLTSSHTAYL